MIRVQVGDLAFAAADALVRPATTLLEPTSTVLRNLEAIAGPSFARQIQPSQELEIGAATVTGAGELDVEFVVHAIIRSQREQVSIAGVRRALQSVMERAVDWQFNTLALPPVGTGAGNLTLDTAAETMADVIVMHQRLHPFPSDVVVVVATEEERAVFDSAFERQAL